MTAPVPLEQAFAIFEDPYSLAKLTPPWLNFRVSGDEKVAMRAGAEICYRIRWMGLPIRWKTRITGYDPPHGFVDEQERGPYVSWRHQHFLEETAGGTKISDLVTYRLPLGPLGAAAHAVIVKRQLLGIFRFRQRAVSEMLGVSGVTFDEPSISRT
jgi:ligand-binding SRPBCC domain-containing protein